MRSGSRRQADIPMENMEGLGTFFLVIIPASILFILITTRSADRDEDET